MKSRLHITTIIAALAIAIGCQARLVKVWTHSELAVTADAIAIIEATSTEKITLPLPEGFPEGADNYQAWETKCKVHSALKGEMDREKSLSIVHFTYSDKKTSIYNGAQFMRFLIGPVKREVIFKYEKIGAINLTEDKYHPLWLAYLKRRADGRFEAVTGQYDAALSFKELSENRQLEP